MRQEPICKRFLVNASIGYEFGSAIAADGGMKEENQMKRGIALLPLVFLSIAFLCSAEDLPHKPIVRRMEFIHYDPVNRSVAWGVSEGTMHDDGDFTPSAAIATYSINLETGVMAHNGDNGRLSPANAYDVSRVFRALTRLMQVYTEDWEDPANSDVEDQDSNEDGPVARIAKVGRVITSPRLPSRYSPSGKNRPSGIALNKEGSAAGDFLREAGACAEWPARPGPLVFASLIFPATGSPLAVH